MISCRRLSIHLAVFFFSICFAYGSHRKADYADIRNFISSICLDLSAIVHSGHRNGYMGKFDECSRKFIPTYAWDKAKDCDAMRKFNSTRTRKGVEILCNDLFHRPNSWGYQMIDCYNKTDMTTNKQIKEVKECLNNGLEKLAKKPREKRNNAVALRVSFVPLMTFATIVQVFRYLSF